MSYNRHYCYKIVFEDGCTYFGVRTCRCSIAADNYTGSPATHATKWLTGMSRVKLIVSVHATRRLANEAEAKLIAGFWLVSKTLSLNAYVHDVGFNTLGLKHTAETRAKQSEASKGVQTSAETRAKLSKANKGRSLSTEHRAKLSKANKGNSSCKGKTHTAETRAKMSKAGKGKRWYTDGVTNLSLAHGSTAPEVFYLGITKSNRAKSIDNLL